MWQNYRKNLTCSIFHGDGGDCGVGPCGWRRRRRRRARCGGRRGAVTDPSSGAAARSGCGRRWRRRWARRSTRARRRSRGRGPRGAWARGRGPPCQPRWTTPRDTSPCRRLTEGTARDATSAKRRASLHTQQPLLRGALLTRAVQGESAATAIGRHISALLRCTLRLMRFFSLLRFFNYL